MDDDEAIIEFASRALEELSGIALRLGTNKRKPLCGRLGGELFIAARLLDDATPELESWLRRRVPKLLNDVESICTWPAERPKDYPCLKQIAQSIRGSRDYRQAESRICQGLTALSSAHDEHIENAIAHIQRFTKRGGVTKSATDEGELASGKMPSGYPEEVKALVYDTLCKHTRCTCQLDRLRSAPEDSWHSARLLLTPMTGSDSEGYLQFDLLLSSAPWAEGSSPCHWQDVELRVPKNLRLSERSSRRVRFAGDNTLSQQESRRDFEEISLGSLCQLLDHRVNARICLLIQEGKLNRFLDSRPTRHNADDGQSISLANMLRDYRLTAKMKAALAYILAFSVWQFYDSDWMCTPWTSETIHFVRHHNSGTIESHRTSDVFPSKPYLSTRFNDPMSSIDSESTITAGEIHRYPRVRALGIMLVEIGLGIPLPRPESEYHGLSVIGRTNRDWSLARETSDREVPWPDFDYKNYRRAVKNALDPGCFASAPFIPSATAMEKVVALRQRRKILYNIVVFPLEQLLHGTGWKDELQSIGPAPSIGRVATGAVAEPMAVPSGTIVSLPAGVIKERKASQRWLKRIDLLNQELVTSTLNQWPRRACIAVLDTGYDPDSTFFHHPRRRNRLIKWKDWTDTAESPADSHGHGTHLVSLIMRIAPEANICVARVAKDPADLNAAAANVAKAIEWASRVCEADVINMSFGYTDDQTPISRAIYNANQDRNGSVIMFAAAANGGANERELFPARHESVISIRGTTSNGRFSDFNPPRNGRESTALGTLGVEVPSAALSSHESGQIFKSGTSVATAVAAGIAGLALTYVEHNSNRGGYDLVRGSLRTRQGMLNVLESMASDTMDQGYLYVAPWCLEEVPDVVRWSRFVSATARTV